MAEVIPDTIDFAAYARQTDAAAKVKPARTFAADLLATFGPPDKLPKAPEMFSTKLRGGIAFRPGEVTAWFGFNGHKKSMFTGQLALDLCVQRQRVLMMSMEMLPAQTLARMARQAIASDRPAAPSLEHFARWTDGRLWLFDHIGRLTPDQCMAVVRYFAQELRGAHVFIDSLMMVCRSEEHVDEQKQFATDAVRVAQELGVHIHVIAHARKPASGDESKPPSKYDLRGSAAIVDQFPNIVSLWWNKPKQEALEKNPHDGAEHEKPDFRACVEKQRNGAWEGSVRLWFDQASLRFHDSRSHIEPYVLRSEGE